MPSRGGDGGRGNNQGGGRRGTAAGNGGDGFPPIESFGYCQTDNYNIGHETAVELGQRFTQIAGSLELITPEQVVCDAQDPSSPLHRHFDWNDARAAHAHRLERARWLIQAVSLEIRFVGGERQRVRLFQNVTTTEGRGYVPTPIVLSREATRAQVLAAALRELEHWQRKYNDLQVLGESRTFVRRAIGWLRSRVQQPRDSVE